MRHACHSSNCSSGTKPQQFPQLKFAMQGVFHVAAQQPVLYTVQESLDLLSLDNKVCSAACLSFAENTAAKAIIKSAAKTMQPALFRAFGLPD